MRGADAASGGTEGTITNLGPEGAFVEMSNAPAVGAKVAMDFRIESYGVEISVRGEVLWRKDGEKPGFGIRFTDIPLFEKNAIGDYILRKVTELRQHG